MLEKLLFASISVTNFVGLTLSLWLGFYIISRSPRSRVSWLAGATLWSLCVYFLSSLAYLHNPSEASSLPWWLGWSVILAVPFWFHLSLSIRPGRQTTTLRLLVILVYLLALSVAAVMTYTPWVFAGATPKSPLYYSAQRPGPLFALLGLFLIIVPALSLYNLCVSWSQASTPAVRRQFAVLLWATALALFSGAYTSLSICLGLDAPVFISNLSLGAAVLLLGYGVARYSALIEGRTIRRDFVYTALATALVISLYLLAAFVSDLVFDVPFIAFVLIIMLAIVSHSLYDWARTHLDRLFYHRQYGDLRARLRQFARTTSPDQDIQDRLQVIIETLCRSLEVTRGFIALREGEGFAVIASWKADVIGQSVASEHLTIDDITVLSPPGEMVGLGDMALIAPLHAGGEQTGAIVLGQRTTGAEYGEDDLGMLDECAHTVGSVVHAARLQERSVQQIDALLTEVRERERELQVSMRQLLAETRPPLLAGQSEREAISLVEDVLRHQYDYPYLGEHALAQLRIIESYLDVGEGAIVTHLDRGRALQKVLIAAIEKLKPPGPQPSPLSRQWHQYIILHDCYVLGKPNRDVMSHLYIGEGTFNRARRRAVRGVTRALGEMEREAQRRNQV